MVEFHRVAEVLLKLIQSPLVVINLLVLLSTRVSMLIDGAIGKVRKLVVQFRWVVPFCGESSQAFFVHEYPQWPDLRDEDIEA